MSAYDLSGSNYSEVDASNNNAAPGGMPEGMAPSGVNDAGRSLMAAVKRAYDWDHAGTWATVGGSANAVTLTYPVAPAAYVQGQKHSFKATTANTAATTINVNSLGVKNVFKKTGSGAAACAGGEIQSGDLVELEYDGTQFQIMSIAFTGGNLGGVLNEAYGGSIASGSTVDLANAPGNLVIIGGASTSINSFGNIAAGARRTVIFTVTGSVLVNSTSLILPGRANITTTSGDALTAVSNGSGVWSVVNYSPSNAAPNKGIAVASVVFNGTTGAIIGAGYNVSSVTRNATGNYTINFASALADANYRCAPMVDGSVGAVLVAMGNTSVPPTTTACGLLIFISTTGAASDSTRISATFFPN